MSRWTASALSHPTRQTRTKNPHVHLSTLRMTARELAFWLRVREVHITGSLTNETSAGGTVCGETIVIDSSNEAEKSGPALVTDEVDMWSRFETFNQAVSQTTTTNPGTPLGLPISFAGGSATFLFGPVNKLVLSSDPLFKSLYNSGLGGVPDVDGWPGGDLDGWTMAFQFTAQASHLINDSVTPGLEVVSNVSSDQTGMARSTATLTLQGTDNVALDVHGLPVAYSHTVILYGPAATVISYEDQETNIWSVDLNQPLTGSITVEPSLFWKFEDADGNALYDEFTGAPL